MVDGVDAAVWAYEYVVADGDDALVENREVVVAHECLADENVLAEVAVQRGVDGETLADASENLPYQPGPFLDKSRRSGIEAETQFLAPEHNLPCLGIKAIDPLPGMHVIYKFHKSVFYFNNLLPFSPDSSTSI